MSVLFPDLEPIIVAHLKTRLALVGFPNAYVATYKAEPDNPQPHQVVVNVSLGREIEPMLREASVLIDVFADSYKDATQIALFATAAMDSVKGDPIKRVELVLGPVRVPSESKQEQRSISLDLVVKGTDF